MRRGDKPTKLCEAEERCCIVQGCGAECGDQGGWIEYVGGVDETEWVMCPCTEEAGNA